MIELFLTDDGSHTLKHSAFDETYHSTKGALTESVHVFVGMGMKHWHAQNPLAKAVRIIEVGFGTGMNAILSFQEAAKLGVEVHYVGLEPYPVELALLERMNYGEWLQHDAYWEAQFMNMHHAPWGKSEAIGTHGFLQKELQKLESYICLPESCDVIYFDAFAPKTQPELWSEMQFHKCFEMLSPGGVLVTYSASGQFKRDLKSAGFQVEKVHGPAGGKREMTRANKPK